jgi:hypothetical protein
VIEKLEPMYTPESPTEQMTVRADALSMHYRERLRDWTARGWRLDDAALAAVRPHSKVLTIPSPARREQAAWVYETVPRRPAATDAANGPSLPRDMPATRLAETTLD